MDQVPDIDNIAEGPMACRDARLASIAARYALEECIEAGGRNGGTPCAIGECAVRKALGPDKTKK